MTSKMETQALSPAFRIPPAGLTELLTATLKTRPVSTPTAVSSPILYHHLALTQGNSLHSFSFQFLSQRTLRA